MQDRRMFLKKLAALGIALPFAGAFSKGQAAFMPDFVNESGNQPPPCLSSSQRAGQRVIYSYAGRTVPDTLLRLIRAGQVAGVIFFGENIASDGQIAAVIQQLNAAQQQSPIPSPLLLMTDQEGGVVRRLPGGPEQSAKQIGEAEDPFTTSRRSGTDAGRNLAAVGMNVNLAPVLGVYRQPGNFLDQFGRSFSQNVRTVSGCGRAFITALQHAGVAATAKHFPGLGSASSAENTDAGPVTLPLPLSTLRAVDQAPYRVAIAAGVKLVMPSWAIYPALDAARPAGLSATVVRYELRRRFGFHGVTITDALEAGALNAFGSNEQRALLADEAGMDLILCAARDVSQGESVTAALASALDGGRLDAAEFNAAVQRVTALRAGVANTRYCPDMGCSISHGFLAYWNQVGGLPLFGYPISEEFTDPETALTVRYVEHPRFECNSENSPAWQVDGGLLRGELMKR